MSLQSKTLLRPLVIPDTDSDKEMVEEKYSRFFKNYSKLKEEDYMLSPANPARWEGASSRARFGLDIGGTLCKVVYFEPFDDFGSVTPLSRTVGLSMPYMSSKGQENCTTRKMPIHEPEQGRIFSEISLSKGAESSIPRVFLEGQENCIIGKMAINEQDLSSEPCCFLSRSNGRYVNEDKHEFEEKNHVPSPDVSQDEQGINEETMKVERSFLAHCSKPVSGIDGVLDGMVDDNEKCVSDSEYLNQVHKIWVSSHDPVILPGRGTLHFKCFETWRMEEFLFLTKEHNLVTDRRALGATGGGARKFGRQFLEIAGLQLDRADELKSLVRGIDFLMKHAQHESFEYLKGSFQGGVIQRPLMSSEDGDKENMLEEENLISIQQVENDIATLEKRDDLLHEMDRVKIETSVLSRGRNGSFSWLGEERKLYPYIVVNIGSGVSILLVESPEQFKRVGGTSLGGSTFFGLTSVLTGCSSFEEAIDLAAEGDSTEIDMLVGDIYGGDYSEMDLAATTVASSFGKLVHPTRRAAAMETPQHLAKAALLMITNNIGSLAKLHAQATGVENVLFTGSFMHGNKLAMRLLSVAMEFWSKGQIKATFLRHEGHAGAMGALLNALDPSNQTDSLLLGS